MQEKGAIKRAGQALGRTPAAINKITTNFNSWDDVKDEELKDVAKHFLGRIQSVGIHASAIMVFPDDATNWCSLEYQKGEQVAAFDYHDIEKMGLLKLDILGLTNLSIVHRVANLLGRDPYKLFNSIPDHDKATCDMLNSGMTVGCFQIESQQMRQFIKDIHITCQDDMSAVMALCRPGPLDSGMAEDYIKRRKSGEVPSYGDERADKILKDTYGVILYQETVMQLAQALCGYTFGQADILRKIIGRKIVDQMEAAMTEFVQKGVEYGTNKKLLEFFADAISKSALYLFNKSHSVAYGITSWRTAYLACHYPAEYYASCIDLYRQEPERIASFITAAQRKGVEVSPARVWNHSENCTVANNVLTLGMSCIKGVGKSYSTINWDAHDTYNWFNNNANVNKTVLRNLVKAGCMDDATGRTREYWLQYIDYIKDKRKTKPLFKEYDRKVAYPETNQEMEMDVYGFTFSPFTAGYDLTLANNDDIIYLMPIKVTAHKTKKGDPMHFVKARTETGVKEYVIFQGAGKDLEVNKMYLCKVRGTIISDFTKARKI